MADQTITTTLVPATPTEQPVPAKALLPLHDAAVAQGISWQVVADSTTIRSRLGQEGLAAAIAETERTIPGSGPFLCLVSIGATPESVIAACREADALPDASGIVVEVMPDDWDEEGAWGD